MMCWCGLPPDHGWSRDHAGPEAKPVLTPATPEPAGVSGAEPSIGFFTVDLAQWYCFRRKGHEGPHQDYTATPIVPTEKQCHALFEKPATPTVAGIDVERLARAIDVADPHSRIFGDESSPSGRRPTMQERLADAAAIAAAYESDG